MADEISQRGFVVPVQRGQFLLGKMKHAGAPQLAQLRAEGGNTIRTLLSGLRGRGQGVFAGQPVRYGAGGRWPP